MKLSLMKKNKEKIKIKILNLTELSKNRNIYILWHNKILLIKILILVIKSIIFKLLLLLPIFIKLFKKLINMISISNKNLTKSNTKVKIII
jgi:hypothetical protein